MSISEKIKSNAHYATQNLTTKTVTGSMSFPYHSDHIKRKTTFLLLVVATYPLRDKIYRKKMRERKRLEGINWLDSDLPRRPPQAPRGEKEVTNSAQPIPFSNIAEERDIIV